MGQKSFNGSDDGKVYPEKNNISEEDINQLKLNDDSHLLQWGIYFNYGNQLNNPPLSLYDAIFKVAFSQDQTLIPSSIKVFEIPNRMAVDQNALRHGINDFYDGTDKPDENYYSIITTGNNEKTKFADFLRAHLFKNATGQATGFSVNQTGQKFNPNDPSYDYSTHAYFIQLDTVLSNKSGQPTSSTGMTSDTSKNALAGQGLLKENKTFSWNGQIKGSSDSETEQTKTISYVINHIYANGSQKSDTPFASDEVTLKFKSEDSGQSWTQYSIDSGKTWNALTQAYTVTVSPDKNANAKYVADLVNIITPDKIRLNNQHQFIIALSTPDGTHYKLTIPYYTTQHADVRFYDDTDKTDQAINKLLNDNGFQLSMTSDEAGQGLSADYQNKDDQSANTPIQFSRLEEALASFKNKHYKIEKVSGANATLKTDSSIGFGNFDNNENVDQHFIIYLVHETQIEKQTATVREEVKGYYVNGPKSQNFSGINNPDVAVPKNDETPTPNVVKEVIYSRSRVVDLVKDPQGTETNWSQWISNNQAFSAIPYNNTTIKDIIDGHYHLDKNGVVHIVSSQNKLTATSNPITGISAIAPSSEFLASIASTTVNGQKTTTGNLATISIWVPYSYSAPEPEPTPTPIPTPESETPTTPEQPKQPSEPNTPYESEPPKSNEYKQTKIHKKVNWNSSSNPYGTDNQRQKQHKAGIIPPHGTAVNNIPKSAAKTRTTNNTVKFYNNTSSKLPQTSQKNSNLGLIGLALATLGLLGFTITKRKHD